jgi:hypothetical protein
MCRTSVFCFTLAITILAAVVIRSIPTLPKLTFIPQQQRVLFWNNRG